MKISPIYNNNINFGYKLTKKTYKALKREKDYDFIEYLENRGTDAITIDLLDKMPTIIKKMRWNDGALNYFEFNYPKFNFRMPVGGNIRIGEERLIKSIATESIKKGKLKETLKILNEDINTETARCATERIALCHENVFINNYFRASSKDKMDLEYLQNIDNKIEQNKKNYGYTIGE